MIPLFSFWKPNQVFPLKPRKLCAGLRFALAIVLMKVPCPRSCELSSAVWAGCLRGLTWLLSLVPQKVAERWKAATVASMLPTLRFGPAHHLDVVCCVLLLYMLSCRHFGICRWYRVRIDNFRYLLLIHLVLWLDITACMLACCLARHYSTSN